MYELPQRFVEFGEARQNGFLGVKALKEQGGRVAGTFCTFTPVEILDAAGIMPVSLCGMSEETIPDAETRLPKNLCPLIKSSYGFALSDKCPYTYFADIIVGETTCDGKKKMYELLGQLKDVYMLHLPQGDRENALDFWTAELHRFIRYLEEKFGIKITEEALRAAAAVRNKERQARLDLMELQKLQPPPGFGFDIYKTMDGAGFIFDRQQVIDKITGLANQMKENYDAGNRPVSEKARRILVTGCPIGGVFQKTVKAIEQAGGVVVCFENCGGIKPVGRMVDLQAPDIVQAIGARYLDIGCAVMSPNPNRMELLRSLISEFAVDGVVEIDLQACTPYCVETDRIRELMRSLGVPYLALETDYSQTDSGQLSTRLEAFLEML